MQASSLRLVAAFPALFLRRVQLEWRSAFTLGNYSSIDWREAVLISFAVGIWTRDPFLTLAAAFLFRVGTSVRGVALGVLFIASIGWGLFALYLVHRLCLEYRVTDSMFPGVSAGIVIGVAQFLGRYNRFVRMVPYADLYDRVKVGGRWRTRLSARIRASDPPLSAVTAGREIDPFRLLGVSESTELPDIKRRYRHLMKHNHPDRVKHLGVREERAAHRNCIELTKAYRTICALHASE